MKVIFYAASSYNLWKAEEKGGPAVHDYILQRVLEIGKYIVETRATVRQVARNFGVSKSTVHKDVTERLPEVNRHLAQQVKKILEINKAERHLRGGEATRRKYLALKQKV